MVCNQSVFLGTFLLLKMLKTDFDKLHEIEGHHSDHTMVALEEFINSHFILNANSYLSTASEGPDGGSNSWTRSVDT